MDDLGKQISTDPSFKGPAFGGTPPQVSAVGAQQYVPAGFWIRWVAMLIDGFILAIVQLPIGIAFGVYQAAHGGLMGPEQFHIFGIRMVLGVLVGFGYTAWFNENKGGTPGKLLFDLRVVDNDTGLFLNWSRTFLREVIGKTVVNTMTIGIGYLIAGFRSDKRGLHDFVAGTRVIRIIKSVS